MSTYQDQPAYQTYQVSPYVAPAQEMVQAIGARQNYWDAAATGIKTAYQNYMNLDLSRQDNHEKLNQLMIGVNQNLKQVNQTDLSIGENYGQALSVFDPISKDDNIMGDNAVTRHYKDQFSIAQGYRIKDNGKEYSDTNVRDLSNHLQDFISDPNASNWRQHYSQRAFYQPYYDTAGEIRQIDKDFKPNVLSSTAPVYVDDKGNISPKGTTATGYMLSQTDKSTLDSQYRAFLTSHLSDKAKDQMALEGRVKYHDNIGALATDYATNNQGQIDYYNKEISRLNAESAGATDDIKQNNTSQARNYKALVDELTLENTKAKAGDFSSITPYKNQIAGQIYSNNYIDYLSKASARKDITVKYSVDQLYQTMLKESHEDTRLDKAITSKEKIAGWNNDTRLEVAGLKFVGGGLRGPGLQGVPAYTVPGDVKGDENFSKDRLDDLRQTSAKNFQDAADHFNQQIAQRNGTDISKMTKDELSTAQQAAMTDPRFADETRQFKQAAALKATEDQAYGAIDNYVDSKIKNENPEIYNARQKVIDSIKSGENVLLTPFKGYVDPLNNNSTGRMNLNLDAGTIKNILNGKQAGMSLSFEDQYTGTTSQGGTGSSNKVPVLTYNGTKYQLGSQIMSRAIHDAGVADKEFYNKRNSLLAQNYNRIMGVENLYQNDKNPYYSAAKTIAYRAMAGTDIGDLQEKDVSLSQKDRFGGVYAKVNIDPSTSKVNLNALKTKVAALGNGARYVESIGAFYLPGTMFGQTTNQGSYNDPRLTSLQLMRDVKTMINPNDVYKSAPQIWGNRNFQFKIDTKNGQSVYKIIDPNSGAIFGNSIDGRPFNSVEDAAAQAENLGNMPDSYYTNLIRTIGGVPGYQPQQ